MITKNVFIVLALALSLFALSACSHTSQNQDADNLADQLPLVEDRATNKSDTNAAPSLDSLVAINTAKGQIVIKLYSDKAPNTVKNFLNKVTSGFYDGLTFHRVEPGFVIQGGDPLGNGTGGGTIESEINNVPFKRGSVGLARGPVKAESNDSQFYICLADLSCQPLTNEYVNFGEVIYGIEVVDQIRVGDKMTSVTTQTK